MLSMLVSIAPLCLLGAISPVVFLNASSALARGGNAAAARFFAGNLVVLLLLGLASMGLLGTTAANEAEREIASRAVDRFLGLGLLCYGGYLLAQFLRKRSEPVPQQAQQAQQPGTSGDFAGGLLGMATNFTTLPIFMSIGQRIGAVSAPTLLQLLIVVVAAGLVASPAWLPMAMRRFSPGDGVLSAGTRDRISAATQVLSIVACLAGALYLLLHGL